jgi:hypothetical protein
MTGFSITPMSSISIRTLWPGRNSPDGFIAIPTPDGVPVAMIMPGNSVNAVDRCSMSCQQFVSIAAVDAS